MTNRIGFRIIDFACEGWNKISPDLKAKNDTDRDHNEISLLAYSELSRLEAGAQASFVALDHLQIIR